MSTDLDSKIYTCMNTMWNESLLFVSEQQCWKKTKMELGNLNRNERKKSLTHFSKINKIIIFSETTWQYKAKWLQSYYENHQIEIRTGCQVFTKWNHWLLIHQNSKCYWLKRNSGKKMHTWNKRSYLPWQY